MEDDNEIIDINEIYKSIKQAQEILPNFRKKARFLSLAQLKKEIADSTAANQWAELNTGLDQWKQKYLYPFGDIAPIHDS